MRKSSILLLLIFFFISGMQPLKADLLYGTFSLGYRTTHMYLGNVNRSVFLYNQTRPWLSQKMGYFNHLSGWEFAGSDRYGLIGLTLDVYGESARQHAEGIEPIGGQLGTRDIRVGMLGFCAGPEVYIQASRHFELKAGAGVDLSWFSIHAVYNKTEDDNPVNEFKVGATLWVQENVFAGARVGLGVRLFYQFFYHQADISNLPYELQGGYYSVPMQEKMTNFGIALLFNFATGDRSDEF